ncbi:MAG: hypothetical protein KDA68_24340 [Planctomycetaceae bacterium]|nr:hypothetical protein [Planctomycetaceae bacterium]
MILIQAVATKFPLGQIVSTPNALETLSLTEINSGLKRHSQGDWGNVCPDDAALNDAALLHGDRILSAYGDGPKRFWIITEADRSVTTILMPEDY